MDKPFLDKLRKIDPYVPGEQPKTDNIIKLNANENPYPPAPGVTEVLRTFDAAKLAIYPDANAKALKTAIAERFDLQPSQVFLGNGSDDVLALAFQSFFCSDKPILYPDITYSFYPVWCDLFRIPYENMPLDEDFCVNVRDYDKPNGGIVLPNPNAPTGRGVTLEFLDTCCSTIRTALSSSTRRMWTSAHRARFRCWINMKTCSSCRRPASRARSRACASATRSARRR